VERLTHAWRIEEREYRRQEERRGRRHAFGRLEPGRTALIVVDVVPFFAEESAYVRGIVPNIARLADAVRERGGTVVWVLPAVAPPTPLAVEFFGPGQAETFAGSGGSGSPRDRLWHEFTVHDADPIVEKSATSAFFPGRSPVPELLRDRGVDNVIITGTGAARRPPVTPPRWASAWCWSPTAAPPAATRTTTPPFTPFTVRTVTCAPPTR
jgi:Isochorismatase family